EPSAGAVTGALPASLIADAAATMAVSVSGSQTEGATVMRATTTTSAEGIVGTVQYMAPEQASGLAVDQRADVYAFGLILYDALAGLARRQSPDGVVGELRARMQQAPPRVRSLVPDVPEALDRLIARCLDPLPDKRFQTTT